MENNFFKSVIDADDAPVVICDLEHTIVYMNPTAVKRYEKRGGAALVGRSIKGCHNGDSNDKIEQVIAFALIKSNLPSAPIEPVTCKNVQ